MSGHFCPSYRGLIAQASCDLPKALEWYRRMTELEPDNWLTWASYADRMAWLCRYDEAVAAYEKAMPMRPRPRYCDCEQAIAHLCELRGDCAGAIRMEKAIIDLLREDYEIVEGETVDAHRREIQRLEAKLEGRKQP